MYFSLRCIFFALLVMGLSLSGCACGGEDPPIGCETCDTLGYECGTHDDGCGNEIDCGPCPTGQSCDTDTWTCVGCTPQSCEELGFECGVQTDNCGDPIDCGGCPAGQDCQAGACVPCTPQSCEQLGFECGVQTDNCGEPIDCGGCPAGQDCQGGVCVEDCTPATCESLGYNCGTHSDTCGGTLHCGECTGQFYECQDGVCVCIPRTCEDLGVECGTWNDGCGNQITCGPCADGYVCRNFDGMCIESCVPQTCEDQGAECGYINDGCGDVVSCGDCPGDQICGGEEANQCSDEECFPESCTDLGFECGSHTDGCGAFIECGPCADGYRCDSQYQCVPAGSAHGEPCTDDDECAGLFCIDEEDFGWRDGFCSGSCETDADCGDDAVCSTLDVCMIECTQDDDCRGAGYMCRADDDGRDICWPGATGDGAVGDPCEEYWDCGGREHGACLDEWPSGYCTIVCESPDGATCPAGSECWDDFICLATCDEYSDCRLDDGYTCWDMGGGSDMCIPGCEDDADCDPYYCDTVHNICVECVLDGHCGSGETCQDGICVGGIPGCDIDGFTADQEYAFYGETQSGPLLAYMAYTADTLPAYELSVNWWLDWGADFTGPGTYPIETNTNFADCGLCVHILHIDANEDVTEIYFATAGEVEVTAIGDDGEPFAGVLHNVVFTEWGADDQAVPGGLEWCVDGYTWSTDIDGQWPGPACTSDDDCSSPTPRCDTGSGACVECLVDGDCAATEECVSFSCVPEGGDVGHPGDECLEDGDCSGQDAFCYPEELTGWEGGYCMQEDCTSDADCISGVCINGICYADCASGADCRDGYDCLIDAEVCLPFADGAGVAGAACDNHRDCGGGFDGFCWTDAGGYHDGYCSAYCQDDGDCPGNSTCDPFQDGYSRCLQLCTTDADCRTGYECDSWDTCWPLSAEIIIEESLGDGAAPQGWTETDIVWETPTAGGYARFSSTDAVLETPVLNLSAYAQATLRFEVARWGSGDASPLLVHVSHDGGQTWPNEFASPAPADANYLVFGPEQIGVGSEVVIRFSRAADCPSQKRLRNVSLIGYD